MNEAPPLLPSQLSVPAERRPASMTFDAERSHEAYALWKSVFEHARVIEAPRDRGHGSAPGSDPSVPACRAALRDPLAAGSDPGSPVGPGTEPGAPRGVASATGAGPGSAERVIAHRAVAPTSSECSITADRAAGASGAYPLAHGPAGTRTSREPESSAQRGEMPRPGAQPLSEAADVAKRGAPSEAISVFVRGKSVAIVVRDEELSTDEALRCAFETAQELAGRRAALERLTLNGRTVYERHDCERDTDTGLQALDAALRPLIRV